MANKDDFDVRKLIEAATALSEGTGGVVDRMTYYSLLSAARIAKIGALLEQSERERNRIFRLYMELAMKDGDENDDDGY